MKRTYWLAAAALTITGLTGAAVAQRGPDGPGGFGLLQFDGNADGKLTRAEFDASQKARFADLDVNKDGSVTTEERRVHRDAQREKMQKARFVSMDADKNGQLSEAEMSAAKDSRADGPRGKGAGDGPRGYKGAGGPGKDGPKGADAAVSFETFAGRGVEAFTWADANKDGTVTIAELQTQRSAAR